MEVHHGVQAKAPEPAAVKALMTVLRGIRECVAESASDERAFHRVEADSHDRRPRATFPSEFAVGMAARWIPSNPFILARAGNTDGRSDAALGLLVEPAGA